MKQIIKLSQLSEFIKDNLSQSKVVLCGGCFDVVHLGHLLFLEKAKSQGDLLVVLLESDQNISRLKGKNRPINSQKNRAEFLTHIKSVDYIILLPEIKKDYDYQKIIELVQPDIIAITQKDPKTTIKKNQAKLVNAKVVTVTSLIPNQSTSLIIQKNNL